ncbi:RHS repeat-associated core domain-containing protein [Sphingobacterium alkalisoli]|uniref:RHS repeat-associated core domain-containing protein n=1 Tax=Sphingobacterium alkalisoli TaxID=1874115 RepID=A0A4U0GPX5_9SPHI|nr:RHS repeat-associated core domain-containing protein [Sphingobacterium alkalisoli]TJY60706.1 RHS repeat-associated core domain-containing protein [Sphingobacterium alkalisoli]GGH31459.1 hypothetical protein GCM10011418_44280 [Sphingobacterium alkalisoli]
MLTQTLPTGNVVYKDDGTAPLLTVSYYDDRGRMIQVASQNHLGGTDYVTNTYSFIGEVLTSKHDHKASPSGAVTSVLTSYTYDHVGRLVDTRKAINGQSEVVQSRLVYNEIGQVKQKKLHSGDNGTNFITQVDYSYNERGWSSGIVSPHFTEVLKYNDPMATATPQYNGNISEQHWGHGTTATPNVFRYGDDTLYRLTSGSSTGTAMSEVLSYDNMGNILTLKRDNATTTSYAYTGNRLTGLSGGMTGSYTYDANGNAKTDRTGMAFTYNHLNLPKTATKTGASVSYLYDAAGSKLRRIATIGGSTTQRDYVAGIEYSKLGSAASSLEMVHTEEGYLQRNPTDNIYSYRYNVTDHLGNVRATLQPNGVASATVIQKDDYYPFGKRKGILTSGINNYLYNGKERLDELAGGSHTFGSSYTLEGQYNYGARLYDAEIGRWNVVDPLSERDGSFSPYAYAFNSPIMFIDPDGRWPEWGNLWNNISSWFGGKETYFGANIEEVVVTASSFTDRSWAYLQNVNWHQQWEYFQDGTPIWGQSRRFGQAANNGDIVGASAAMLNSFAEAASLGMGTLWAKPAQFALTSRSIPIVTNTVNGNSGKVIFDKIATAAAHRLGFFPEEVVIQNGIAEIPITYMTSVKFSDITLIFNALKTNGATSVTINTGPIVNHGITPRLLNAVKKGVEFMGFKVTQTGNPNNMFMLSKEL